MSCLPAACFLILRDLILNFVCPKQARAVSTDGLRHSFFTINAVVYTIQVIFMFYYFGKMPIERRI